MSRLYLSGPITGVENFEKNFQEADRLLRSQGYQVINPAPLYMVMPGDATHEEYLQIDLQLIDLADGIVLLPGWENSRGANREIGYALGTDKHVLKISDFEGGKQ
jgi:nucleoside 2-deoxyribosyltransferase